MNSSKEVTATFIEEWYTLNITTVGNGTVNVDPIGPYRYGTGVTLTAISDPGWSFDSWSGDLTGSDNPETIVMDGNKEVTVMFTETPIYLCIDVFEQSSFVASTINVAVLTVVAIIRVFLIRLYNENKKQ